MYPYRGQPSAAYRPALKSALGVLVFLASCALAGEALGPTQGEIQEAIKAAADHDYGQEGGAFAVIDKLLNATAGRGELRAGLEKGLIQLLEDKTSLACKQEACRRLRIIGTDAAVPALARLLAGPDAHAAEAACYALELRASPAVGQALRDALAIRVTRPKADSGLLAIIALLGDRRDGQCSEKLIELARKADRPVAEAAIAALGKIAAAPCVAQLTDLLAKSDPERRRLAAHALLQAGRELASRGQTDQARAVFTQLAGAEFPRQVRRGAVLGRILLAGDQAAGLVRSAMKDPDPIVQAAAIAAVTGLSDTSVATFAFKLADLPPPQQVLMIEALATRGVPTACGAIRRAASHSDLLVRVAALRALGELGDAWCVPALLGAFASPDPEESRTAALSLRKLKGPDVDVMILVGLQQVNASRKAELIDILVEHQARNGTVTSALLAEARGDDASTAEAALRGLGHLGSARDLPPLLRFLTELKGDGIRAETERAAMRLVRKIVPPRRQSEAVLEALANAKEPAARASLLRVLAVAADEKALAAVRDAVASDQEAVREAAIRILADWPDARAQKPLLDLLKAAANPAHRVLALRGYVRLVEAAADHLAGEKARLLGDALAYCARPEDKKLVIALLSRVNDSASLDVLMRCLDDPAVRDEAALGAIAVARRLPPSQSAAVQSAMAKVAALATDETIRAQARGLIGKK